MPEPWTMIESLLESAKLYLPLVLVVTVWVVPVPLQLLLGLVLVPLYTVYVTEVPAGAWNVMLLSVKVVVATLPEDPVAVTS